MFGFRLFGSSSKKKSQKDLKVTEIEGVEKVGFGFLDVSNMKLEEEQPKEKK